MQNMTKMLKTGEKGQLYDSIEDYNEKVYDIIQTYFDGHHTERLVRHQIESFNDFVNNQVQKTIQMFNPIKIHSENDYIADKEQYYLEIEVQFENLKFHPALIHENNGSTKKMMPQEAKLRNITYASNMTLDMNIQYIIRNTENMDEPKIITKKMPGISIGKMPIMLKSSICALQTHTYPLSLQNADECNLDCGGYFILKGSEKTVLGQERTAENKIYCFDGKNTTKWSWMAEMKSVPDYKCISPKQIEMMISNKGGAGAIYIQIPRIKIPVELFTLFRAMGVTTDKKICEYICFHVDHEKTRQVMEFLTASVTDASKYMTQETALSHIISHVAYTPINIDRDGGQKRKREFALEVLRTDLLPHCTSVPQKLYLLGMMASKLIRTSFGWLPQDDRDSYLNKRIELTGTLLNNLFRNYYNKLLKEMQKLILREINTSSWRSTHDYENIINMTNIYKLIKPATIENGINRALSTGDFSIKQMNSSKVGVAQVLNRLTYPATLSHMRRINTPIEKSGELIPPRKLHTTTWGYLCLAGDTEVLLANRMDMKKIKDMQDGQWVTTVNRQTLDEEPSFIHHYFGNMPDKLFEVTTISGRKIKATAEHPFLVRVAVGKYEMKKVGELQLTDHVVIRHMCQSIPEEGTTQLILKKEDIVEKHYYIDLLEGGFLNIPISINKLKIIARLIGSLNTDGHLGAISDKQTGVRYYSATFYLGEQLDSFQLADDVTALGFGGVGIERCLTKFVDKNNGRVINYSTWSVSKSGAFAYLLSLLGGIPGNKTHYKRSIPTWLMNAELSIQREFLSAFQGGDGCRISSNSNIDTFKPHLGSTCQTTLNEHLVETVQYMDQIVQMFKNFNIQCKVSSKRVDDEKSRVFISFGVTTENIARYADIIGYTYCEEKRRKSACVIEHIKIRQFNESRRSEHYQYILDNYKTETIENMVKHTELSERQVYRVISKTKEGKRPNPRMTTEVKYNVFLEENCLQNGNVSVPIYSIREIKPEMVYDFTTQSHNHSFVASSFVLSNCPIESPEGQSVGVVKNIAYMAHITIPSNSAALYEYVKPWILSLEDVTDPAIEVFEKVKVLVNGCWVGVTDTPMELLGDLRNKKHTGVINVYTSIVFDFPLAEIRVCADGGRLSRPVLRIQGDNHLVLNTESLKQISAKKFQWNDLMVSGLKLDESVIEYIDPDEQSFALIAMNTKKGDMMKAESKQYTHAEIHPSTYMGILASCIPFPDHNQAPRNTYQCLDVKELVWMADGSQKEIRNVCLEDRVLTFHPETLDISETRVVNQFVRRNEYPIYKLKTVGGQEITATGDHRFMTFQGERYPTGVMGWKTVEEMRKDRSIRIGLVVPPNGETQKIEFVPVKSITRERDGLISCIETESENHSFIAGGFLSSNCAMQKQAMGIYATNYDKRMDKTGYILTYPMRPLVDTRLMNFIHINEVPSGCQIFVAIMTNTGYNQEDSVLINKGAIDRGLFVTTIYHTEKDEDKNVVRDEIIRCKPDSTKTRGIKFGNYEKLNAKGFIPENTLVENRDVIIAKVTPIKENRNDPSKIIKYEDQSKVFRTIEETFIDKNMTGRNGDGYNFAKTRTRIFRKPVIGDKFASRSSQKGTLGNIVAEEDMPFTKNGLRPDLILNPHAIPSRMTIAQLKETLLGKVLLELGMFGDGTAFSDLSMDTIRTELQNLGYESCGNEIMYNGETGKQLEASVFIGPVFYQRLKHMVNDKQHSRSIGPMVNLTRQPAEGRCRDGGFRIGEMERDVMIGHGISEFCKERLMDASDKYSMHVCRKCGLTASYNDGLKKTDCLKGFQTHLCNTCQNRTEFARVEIPYTYKLLMQELQTVNIATRFLVE